MPGRARVFRCLVATLVLAAVVAADGAVHDFTFRHVVSHEVRLVANGFTLLGTAWAASGLLAAVAVIAHRSGDVALVRASAGGLAGIAVGSLAVQVVKHLACRARPKLVDGWGVDRVGPGGTGAGSPDPAAIGFFHWPCLVDSRYHSFPSGHTTTAFAVAAALTAAVPARRRTWLAVAAGIGASRLLLNAHFLSDILAGAVIGWWAGTLGIRLVDRLAPLRAVPAVESGAGAPSG
jgi:undecaprenyl-diphosphatase